MTRTCPNCHREIPTNSTEVCPNCDASLPPVPTLTGTPVDEKRYLMISRGGDIALGIVSAPLFLLITGILVALVVSVTVRSLFSPFAGIGLATNAGLPFLFAGMMYLGLRRPYPLLSRAFGYSALVCFLIPLASVLYCVAQGH